MSLRLRLDCSMLKDFLIVLRSRNELLFWFGLICLIGAISFLALSVFSRIQVAGTNAWYKPFKFCLSTCLFAWAMAWYNAYLEPGLDLKLFDWVVTITLGFEIVYIALQASKGQLSHYNQSSPTYAFLFSLMAIAATIATLATAYIGFKFFQTDFPQLPDYYLWAIRIGIILFVIFSFEGFVMGANMAHTIGGADGGTGLPLLNWSTKFGDPRIAHFIGMHALQVLPILAFYLLKDLKLSLVVGGLYSLLAIWVLVQALQGKPFFKF